MRSICCFNYIHSNLSILVQRALFEFENKTDHYMQDWKTKKI